MRVSHLVATRTPANIQGNERHVAYLAGAQRARGMDAVVVSNRNGLLLDLCRQQRIPAFVVDDLPLGGGAGPGAGTSAPDVVAKLRRLDPEIIHCHDLFTAKAVVVAANRIKVPCVITLHEVGVEHVIGDFIAARRAGLKFTLIAVSKGEFEIMREKGMAGIDFHYVPYGTQGWSGARRQERGTPRGPNLILVGNVALRKGIDLALLAMVELRRRRGPECPVLNIYGAGDLGDYFIEEYFIEMARVLDLDDVVKFHGVRTDILDECHSSDVLIAPSRTEKASLVIMEAMSRGMPIVACGVGDVDEMLPDRRYGRVVPVNSILALADEIDSLLADIASGEFNPDLLIDRHHSRYSVEAMADRTAAVYGSAIARLG